LTLATKFKPLTLDGLEEGEFVSDANTEFAKLQKQLVAFCRAFRDKAEKAAAVLTLKLTVKCEEPDSGLFSVKSSMCSKLPTRPDGVSVALVAEDSDGEECLFARESGADEGNPRQTKLATKRGETLPVE
jgi:hypothetical protein